MSDMHWFLDSELIHTAEVNLQAFEDEAAAREQLEEPVTLQADEDEWPDGEELVGAAEEQRRAAIEAALETLQNVGFYLWSGQGQDILNGDLVAEALATLRRSLP